MKTKKDVLYLIAITLIVTATAFYSCKKSNKEKSLPEQSSIENKNAELSIFNQIYKPSIYFTKSIINSKNKRINAGTIYDFGKVQVESIEIQYVYNDLKQYFGNVVSNIVPKSIILYSNSPCTNIIKENLTGFSFISFSQGQLSHQLFKVINNSCVQINEFNYTFNGYDSRDFSLLLLEKIKGADDEYASFLMLTCPEFNAFTSPNHPSVFLTKSLIENQVMYRPMPKNQCETCEDESETESCVKDNNGDVICSGGCMNRIINRLGDLNNQPVNLDIRKAYSFRDFLHQYKKGDEYILYYYKISYVIGGLSLVNSENLADNVVFMTIIYNMAQRIQYGSNDEIIIDNTLKDVLLEKINSYKNVSENREFNNILNKIEADVLLYQNKTRIEILQQLN